MYTLLSLFLAAAAAPSLAEAVAATDPAVVAAVQDAVPLTSRVGAPRFVEPALRQPAAAAPMLDRLMHSADPPAIRQALAEALPRTNGDWGSYAVAWLPAEADPVVRSILIEGLRDVPTDVAIPGIQAGLIDADPTVRAAAARTAGWVEGAGVLLPYLAAGLADVHPEVRAAACRSWGLLGLPIEALLPYLADADTDVRLQAVRAVLRIDPARPELTALQHDPDPRIAAAVAR